MSNLSLLPRTENIDAQLNLPGSKSIANRVLLLAAIAHGTSVIHNVPDVAQDVQLMLAALEQLGVRIKQIEHNAQSSSSSYEIEGCAGEFSVKSAEIFCGNSGTTIRFLGAVLALMPGEYTLTGVSRMQERPIQDMVTALRPLGAQIKYLGQEGFPPFKTSPYQDAGIESISVSGKLSSQYLSGILMALTCLKREIKVHIKDELISKPYVDITLAILRQFGYAIDNCGADYILRRHSDDGLRAITYTIEPDASSASYFLAMGAIGGRVQVYNLGENSLQGDKKFACVLQSMGAKVDYLPDSTTVSKDGPLQAIKLNLQHMPDVAMTVATLALFAHGTSTISGIASWKVKETDRLQAMYNELSKLGAAVTISDDSIEITPPQHLNSGVAIDTYNDHRMAMCFSLIAAYGIPVIINDYECVGKTFANYFTIFNKICYT